MNYYEHHLGDYLRDTAHLSMLEDGAYRRLLDAYYIKEKPLPLADRDVFRVARAHTGPEREAVQIVLQEFFQKDADGWHHKRCDAEIAHFKDKQEKAKRSANARWSNRRPPSDGNANASPNAMPPDMRTHSEGNAPQSPIPNHQTEIQGSVCVNGIPEPQHTHTPIPTEYRDRARTSRPDLNPDAVWQDFCGHYTPDKRTANRWDKWIAREEYPGQANGDATARVDPESKGAVTAMGIELGVGPWDELKEPFPAYKARVRQVQFQQTSRGA
jgi:uncharacterized protein YdaU (DUF1376 family)